jgi:hypothetical protein
MSISDRIYRTFYNVLIVISQEGTLTSLQVQLVYLAFELSEYKTPAIFANILCILFICILNHNFESMLNSLFILRMCSQFD